jgi:hypothetical protein
MKLWLDTCKEVLRKRKPQHKEWISSDTIKRIEIKKEKKATLSMSRTRAAKVKAQEDYTAADKDERRVSRRTRKTNRVIGQSSRKCSGRPLRHLRMVKRQDPTIYKQRSS